MIKPYRLTSTIGRSYNVDPEDTLNTKNVLKGLGYYKTPAYGMTPYPDEPLFDGIKSYQRANKLRVDGIMKPDGETMRSLHKTLAQAESHEANKSDQPKTCPEGQYPVNNPICIPKTGLCMDNWVCEPYPSGGGIRG